MFKTYIPILLLALDFASLGQVVPESAHVNLYFPHFADGGARSQQWQTTFNFVNISPSAATIDLLLYADDGGPLELDLGSGRASRHQVKVPAYGSRILRSRVAFPEITVGWAVAFSDVPVQATVAFRMLVEGKPFLEVTALPTLPTLDYISAAKRTLGVALANVYTATTISVDVGLVDSEGNLFATSQVTVPPKGHRSFVLHQLFPGLSAFTGTLILSGTNRPQDSFLAWTLYENDGLLSNLPPGGSSWPISHWDRIWLVYQRVTEAAKQLEVLTDTPELKILSDRIVNAYARGGREVGVTLGLSQLISDSPSELAFALAHELGHIYQQRNSGRLEWHENREFDADIWGTLIALVAGYDPYASAGTLAKLSMATGRAGLADQFEDELSSDAHKSFNARLDAVYDTLVAACNSSADLKRRCADYKGVIHPNLPPAAPLRLSPRDRQQR